MNLSDKFARFKACGVPMVILDGKALAEEKKIHLKIRTSNFHNKYKRAPQLVVILVGEDPASQVYVRNKLKACESAGILSSKQELPALTTQAQLNSVIEKLNHDSDVDGILVQLPLPKHLSQNDVIGKIDPKKDVDCFTAENCGMFWLGQQSVSPCTPAGIMNLLEHHKIQIAGKYAVVIGRSHIVGKPMAHLLMSKDATVTICHSKTPNMKEHTLRADILVVAAGQRHLLGKNDIKQGAVVVDVGMHRGQDQKLTGDVKLNELKNWASAMTPVPGGVGPMTIATLLENTMTLAEIRATQQA